LVDLMGARVSNIGIIARQVLSRDQNASVLGVTSRGIFLQTQQKKVIFLSREKYRGPLTLNIEADDAFFEGINLGDRVIIHGGNLAFPRIGLTCSSENADVWKPSDPPPLANSKVEIKISLDRFAQLLPAQPESFSNQELKALNLSLRSFNLQQVASQLIPFLGKGAGLTPSGDDLIVGFLLALNRWGKDFLPFLKVKEPNLLLVQAAPLRTTSLSASLIESAAQGMADERLILALDSLVTGVPDVEECITCLRNYGNTSGRDAFMGMRIVLYGL